MKYLCLFLAFTAVVDAAEYDWDAMRGDLGRKDKMRIIVDKVMMTTGVNQGTMTAKHLDEIKEAGFNIVSPRWGGTDMERVKRVANMCTERGLFYVAWMRGTREGGGVKTNKDGSYDFSGVSRANRVVWQNGTMQTAYSPNSDKYWEWMSTNILNHARLSLEIPSILGTFLDFENYYKKSGDIPRGVYHMFGLSYDDEIINKFAQAQNIEVPKLELEKRAPWLKKHGLMSQFRDFQIAYWRKRCRELRQAIDTINPKFRLLVYPGETLFLNEAAYLEWATPRAPFTIAIPWTYWRAISNDKILGQQEALNRNRRTLCKYMAIPRDMGIGRHYYLGGVDPICRGADPEFCAKNASMLSEAGDGYWVFYEGPSYKDKKVVTKHHAYSLPGHSEYFRWFKRANQDIVEHKFILQHQPREEPDPWAGMPRSEIQK